MPALQVAAVTHCVISPDSFFSASLPPPALLAPRTVYDTAAGTCRRCRPPTVNCLLACATHCNLYCEVGHVQCGLMCRVCVRACVVCAADLWLDSRRCAIPTAGGGSSTT